MQDFNYHTHTYRCGHADMSMSDEEYVKMFIEYGFKKIAFTDHVPFMNKIDFRNNMRMDYSMKDEYYKSIKTLKEKYKILIDIEVGFEFEYVPSEEEYLKQLKKETDKMILGQHFVCDDDGSNFKIIGYSSNSSEDVLRYAYLVKEAMEKGLVDIVAHPDLFMLSSERFGETEQRATRIICESAVKYGVPLEINLTRIAMFLVKESKKIAYPCKEFWKIASEYHVKVVYGVDAHFRNQISSYKECVEYCSSYLGEEIISNLVFCDKNL